MNNESQLFFKTLYKSQFWVFVESGSFRGNHLRKLVLGRFMIKIPSIHTKNENTNICNFENLKAANKNL